MKMPELQLWQEQAAAFKKNKKILVLENYSVRWFFLIEHTDSKHVLQGTTVEVMKKNILCG